MPVQGAGPSPRRTHGLSLAVQAQFLARAHPRDKRIRAANASELVRSLCNDGRFSSAEARDQIQPDRAVPVRDAGPLVRSPDAATLSLAVHRQFLALAQPWGASNQMVGRRAVVHSTRLSRTGKSAGYWRPQSMRRCPSRRVYWIGLVVGVQDLRFARKICRAACAVGEWLRRGGRVRQGVQSTVPERIPLAAAVPGLSG